MSGDGRVLIVDDDAAACHLLAEVLGREGYEVGTALSVREAMALVEERGPFDAVVTDLRMPGASGLDLLRALRERAPDAPVIVVTAFGDATVTGEAIHAGAYDFLSKPYDLAAVRQTVSRAVERRRLALEERDRAAQAVADAGPKTDAETPLLVGRSPAIIDVVKTLARVARSQATVLLQGESGTGKELAARTLHHWSDRADRRFVAVNCGSLTETLLESELFGHVKGARGVRVADVRRESQAYAAGLRAGDIITSVDREPVTSVDELKQVAQHGDGPLLISAQREHTELFLVLR